MTQTITSRAERLGWPPEKLTPDKNRDEVQEYAAPPPDSLMWRVWARERWLRPFFWFLEGYVLGGRSDLKDAANAAVHGADFLFFGDWKTISPTPPRWERPPDPEYWHQKWGQDDDFVEAACIASCLERWDFIERLSKYMSEIRWDQIEVEPGMRWIDIQDGREESAWRLILAGVIYGLRLDRELEPLVEIVIHGRCARERLLFRWLEAIAEEQPDEAIQTRANEYFEYYLKHEVRQQLITAKVMIEGTLMVNYTRHRGRKLVVPDEIGERYITVAKGD